MKILFANGHSHETPGILRYHIPLTPHDSLSSPAILTLFAGYANLLLIGTLVQRAAVAQCFSPEVHEEILALMHELDLEFVGVERRLKRKKYP